MRFPEFEGEWETKKLGEIATFSKGKGISKSDIEENGIIECIRYGELYTHYREVINEIKSKTNLNTSTLILSEKNDVIIPASGETTIDIATASCVLKSGIALGGDLNIIKTKNNGIFLSYYLNSKKKMEIANLAQGISVVHLYSSQLASLSLNLPKLNEQNRISSFLALIDERIQTQNKIIKELETLIYSFRNQLFKQKIRFIDHYKEKFPKWVKYKMCDISERIVKKNSDRNQNVLTISAQFGLISQLEFFNKSVSAKDVSGYYLLEKNEFAYNKSYSKGYPMGAIKRLKKYNKGIVSTLYICFRLNPNVNLDFMEQYFESGIQNPEIEKIAQEGARNHGLLNVGVSDFFNIEVNLPSLEEQQKIASFLSSLDQKIQAEMEILIQFENQKKYLLQQMFI